MWRPCEPLAAASTVMAIGSREYIVALVTRIFGLIPRVGFSLLPGNGTTSKMYSLMVLCEDSQASNPVHVDMSTCLLLAFRFVFQRKG